MLKRWKEPVERKLAANVRRVLFVVAGVSLIVGSLTAQAAEAQFAARLQGEAHAATCPPHCSIRDRARREPVGGWPYPLLPFAALALSAVSLVAASRIPPAPRPRRPERGPRARRSRDRGEPAGATAGANRPGAAAPGRS